jgi:glycosyltransferase involved in cell wall biosynthesis
LEWITSKITTHFIAVSSANIATGMHYRLFSPTRVSLIRSGIDIARFQKYANRSAPNFPRYREILLKELDLPQDKSLVGMVACFKPQKAPGNFVQTIKLVAKAFPETHAVMVGDGILRPQIEAMIARNNLEHTISLLGWRTDIPKILPLFELLVLTSFWEGLPRVCPQAMAAGLPIVATDVDGIPEAVQDGVNGFLLPPGDIQGMAEKIIYLLKNPDIASHMGQQGCQRVGEFDIQHMVHQQEELYQRLVKQRQ